MPGPYELEERIQQIRSDLRAEADRVEALAESDRVSTQERADLMSSVVLPLRNAADALREADRWAGIFDRVVEGNPGEGTLHSMLSEVADHLDYEASVVEAAADDIEDDEIAELAHDQAEAMEDAAEAADEAAEAAADTAAEVFNQTGTAQDDPQPDPDIEDVRDGNPVELAGDGDWIIADEDTYAPSPSGLPHGTISISPSRATAEANAQDHANRTGRPHLIAENVDGVWTNHQTIEPTAIEGNPASDADMEEPSDQPYPWDVREIDTSGERWEIAATGFGPWADASEAYNFAQRYAATHQEPVMVTFEGESWTTISPPSLPLLTFGNPGESPVPTQGEPTPTTETEPVPDSGHVELVPADPAPAPPQPADAAPTPSHWYTRPIGGSK